MPRVMKRRIIVGASFIALLLIFGSCVEFQSVDQAWEAPGPIKVRVSRKYSLGNDYYFFDAFDTDTGRWKRVMSAWRDATGSMPSENVRSLDAHVGYLFLVDQVAVTKDAGRSWTVFNTSKYFNCGWDGCANIKDVTLSSAGNGSLTGSKRVGTAWVEYELLTNDFGVTWHSV